MDLLRRRLGFDLPFRWRGTEMSRVEAFSDAVFAFALTLIVVSLEPPTSFADLEGALAKFPGFALAFVFLLMIWVQHTLFFRRYGLQDLRTLVLNSLLMFLVLFYVYPMQYLVSILASVIVGSSGWEALSWGEWRGLMTIYGAGFAAVNGTLWLMFRHARKHADELELDAFEIHRTRASEGEAIVNGVSGLLSVAFVQLIPLPWAIPVAGWTYALLWPAHWLHAGWRTRNQPDRPAR